MRTLILAGTSLLALTASLATARATPVTFTYTGAIVTYTVSTTGTYNIVAYGAQGGDGLTLPGGLGARIGGDVILTQSDIIQIAVGGVGGNNNGYGGGGGGSFVVTLGGIPLMIAAGGGGAGLVSSGGAGVIAMGNGTGGQAGAFRFSSGGGGGGFLTAGASAPFGGAGGGGYPALSGGGNGGFGGGGGSGGIAGGGGGGYSGGDGGSSGRREPGNGGGSFDAGLVNADFIQIAGVNSGNGLVTLDLIDAVVPAPVPEPVSFGLLATGLVGLAITRWRRGPA